MHGRAQHALMVTTILVLAVTGLPQKFESVGLSRQFMDAAGGIEHIRLIHHIAAGALIFAGVYHVAAVLLAVLVFRVLSPFQMIPDARDFRDAVEVARYFLGLGRRRVAFVRPSYFQKIDYWVIAGSFVVMAASGLMALFPVRAAGIFTGEAVLAALRLHSDSAVLVVAWVLILHIIYVGLVPALFPYRAAVLSYGHPREDLASARAPAAGPYSDPPVRWMEVNVAAHGGREKDAPRESERGE